MEQFQTLSQRGLYRLTRIVLMAFFRTWLRLSVSGTEKVPKAGGFVLAPGGHRSIIDTGVVAASSPRMLRYMGAEKYFEVPGLGFFLRSVGGFPVERDATDRAALRLAEDILRSGAPLVVFPESTRFEGPVVQPLKEGAAFLAARAGVPIVPVGIGGAERAWPKGGRFIRPHKMAIVVGDPIMPPVNPDGGRVKRSQMAAMTAELHDRLQQLFDEADRRAGVR